jgi:hypothetical protein
MSMPSVGLAHVASASFLASRVSPTGGFAIALAGGVALARAAQRLGLRMGFGASLAAMLQTIAIMGPMRVSIPLTQAITAPLLGRMEARGQGTLPQVLVTIAIRAAQNLLFTLFYVWVILGIDAYAGSYDQFFGWLPLLPEGRAGALVSAAIALVAWAIGASIVQVLVYRRGLRRWPAPREDVAAGPVADVTDDSAQAPVPVRGRFDPRAVMLAAIVAFAILLTGTWWPMLIAVAAWLTVAWALARGDRSVVRPGLILAALLASGTLVAGLVAGLGLELTLRRTVRAALLVLVATWLRYAAGEEGLREVFRRALHRFDRVPAARETAKVLEGLGSTAALAASGRRLIDRMKGVKLEPLPITDAVLDWVAGEAGRHAPAEPTAVPALRARRSDAALVAFAVLCALALPLAT